MKIFLNYYYSINYNINKLLFYKIGFATVMFGFLILNMFLAIAILKQNANAQSSIDLSPISLERLDFETGDLSQWIKGPKTTTAINNCHEHDYPGTNNHLEVVNSIVKQGTHALKVTLTEKAIIIPGTGTTGERAELKYCDSPRHVHLFRDGDDTWYHWYTQFSPTEFTVPTPPHNNNWHVWTQWHGLEGTTNYGVPIGFNLNANLLNLRVLGGVHDSQQCYTIEQGKCGYLWVESLQKGIWYEILLHIKWSTNNDGLVEGWIKKDGELPKLFLPYGGPTLNPNGPADTTMYLKQGLYRNQTINELQVVYHDGMVIAKINFR
jgi:Polysaccharide lyase